MDSQMTGYFVNLMQSGSNFDEILMTDSECFNQDGQEVVQQTQFTNQTGSLCKKRGVNFTIEEDKLLVSAWLNVSLDPIKGNAQKKGTFWQRVKEVFGKCKQSNRTETSLMHRWSSIQLATNKFCSCYAKIESLNQSGKTEEDKVEEAMKTYEKIYGSPFQFEHCWVKLKNQPKWFLECERKNQIKRPTIGSPELEIIGDDNAEIDNVVDLERPTGIKAAKKAKINPKNRDDEPNSSPNLTQISGALDAITVAKTKFVDKKVEMLEKAYAQEEEKIRIKKEMMEKEQSREQEKLRIKKEKLEMEQFREEERIMLMDLSHLSKDQQEFYKNRQTEILVKSRRI